MLRRFSSRRASLYEEFLKPHLAGATRYDRIAGYFQSSLLELASKSLAHIPRIRIVCNTEVSAEDVKTVRMATGVRRRELEERLRRLAWNAGHFPHLVDVHGAPAQQRLKVLHDLLMASGKDGRLLEIRLVPDAEFGFVHGKGGIIEGDWGRTSFIGSANDSSRAWTKNYELVWEDDDPDSVAWLQEEFDALWGKAFLLSEFIVKQIGRLAQRTVIEQVGPWKEKPAPEPLLAEVPTATELFGFWDHQKYFVNLAFHEHLKYRNDAQRGARFLLCDGVGLGKTLQLGAIAKLIGALDNLPILIMAPKPLLEQWQEELLQKLAVPSARWESGGWVTESDSIYPLEEGEKELLQRLGDHLAAHLEREDDPKFERVREVLNLEFEGQKWLERGVLIFSQFYDSAYALAEYLLKHFDEPIGLYANSSASKLFENGKVQSVDRELLKEKVTQGRLKLLIGTDAAIFGTVPDFIVDQWVTDMLENKAWDENTVLKIIAERQENPFTLKETTESLDSDWEGTAEVLNQIEAYRALIGGW